MLTRNIQCQENVSVRKPPMVGTMVPEMLKSIEMMTISVTSGGPRNFAYTTGHTVGVMAPPQNPCSAR
jgi:hypothetical protein